jgi:hypothetical protein
MIALVKNDYSKKSLNDRYIKTLNLSKKTPNNKALSHKVLSASIEAFIENVIDVEAKTRVALDMPLQENWQCIPEEWTPEQRQTAIQQEALKVAEQLKKNKKKPKTAEEEQAEKRELQTRTVAALCQQFTEGEIDRCEAELEMLKTEWLMRNHLKMDCAAFEKLNRKVSVLDIDIADMEVVLRTDLDVPLTPYQALPPLEEEFKDFLQQQQEEASLKKKQKKTKKQQEEDAEMQSRYEQGKLAREEPWKSRHITDLRLVKRTE